MAFSPDSNLLAVADTEIVRVFISHKSTLIKQIKRNSASATAIVFSPDNAVLVIGLYDGKIELWNLETEDKPIILDGHTATVKSLIFSPDGKTLVSTGNDGTILLWDWDEVLKGTPVKDN